ncbi:MAG: hypothetical protein ABSG81_12295 [Acidimicrobiales bacterium]
MAAAASAVVLVVASATPAFADSQAYELYCPGTPVGNIALNGVVTTGTITPASPAAGATFNLTNYQSMVSLPTQIVTAAAALGNSAISGTAAEKIDATGATPASIASPTITIDTPIPSPVPATGLALTLPSTPGSIGPFKASGGAISLTVDPAVSLTLNVSGSNLSLTCHPYPNNTVATGIVTTAPSGAQASPVIATSSAGSAPATTPTTAAPTTPTTAAPTTPTTAPPATSPGSGLASTGPGPDLWIVALVGFIVLYLGSVSLALVERPRSLLRRLLRMQQPVPAMVNGPVPAVAVPAPVVQNTPVVRPAPTAMPEAPHMRTSYPRAGGSQGLWFDGLEPDNRNQT